MYRLYSIPINELILISFLLLSVIVLHSIATVVEIYRLRKNRRDMVINELLNFTYLLYLLECMREIAHIRMHIDYTYFAPDGFTNFRYIVFVLACILTVAEFVYSGDYSQFADIPFLFLTLPLYENDPRYPFHVFAIVLLAFFTIRSVYIILRDIIERHRSISYNSVYEAVSMIEEGVLLCEPNGFILVCNPCMQKLMYRISGKLYRNGNEFYNDINDGESFKGCERKRVKEGTIFVIEDKAWCFSKDVITADKKTISQISATDVTSLWEAMRRLSETREELAGRSDQLKNTIRNIEAVCLEEEIIRMKNNFHDVLGQRIALLLRNMRENKEPDENLLRSFADSFYDEIKEAAKIDGMQRINTIVNMMSDIDVNLEVKGKLPEGDIFETLYVEIIREASTNAVRHGFAKNIFVKMNEDTEGYTLEVKNDGIVSEPDSVTEGGGLTGIRRKLLSFEGTLDVIYSPMYTLNVFIPK